MSFNLQHTAIPIDSSKTLFELAEMADIVIPSSCKKQGKCKECLIEITEGIAFLSPRGELEKHLDDRYRLSCQTTIIGGENEHIEANLLQRPMLKIEDRGLSFIADLELDPSVIRKGEQIYWEEELIDVSSSRICGLAIDIGTTTVVVRTIDLETGVLISTIAFENPQRFAGSNVMARIAYDTAYGKKELRRVLMAYLTNVLLSNKESNSEIYEVVIGGNTTMRDLFFGVDVRSIGQSPYHSKSEIDFREKRIDNTSLCHIGKKMNLAIHPKARVYGLPIIGGHVGADTAACILAVDMMHSNEVIVIMDIGTNTEIVIGHNGRVYAASSPSGPAFEGGGIVKGMPALNGAIEKVKIQDSKVSYTTIGNEKPIGICGSGLIDTIGELRRNNIINIMGRFEEDEDQINLTPDGSVFLNEHDINLLAQTKGANSAALSILFKQFGIDFNEVDKFYLAGGFGQHIDIEAGIRIGILPEIDQDKYIKIGNAAIEGVSIALLSNKKRKELESFVKTIKQINLESDPDFFDYFVDGCMFEKLKG